MNSDSWTSIGKGGKAIRGGGGGSGFPAGAAEAFGQRVGRAYDGGGYRDRGSRWSDGGGFSESASAAFGGGGRYVPPSSRSSAPTTQKPKPVEKPDEEAFPALGHGSGAPVAKPAANVVPTAVVPGAMSFASLVKKTAEEEAAAEETRRYTTLRDAEARKAEERERRLISAIRTRTTYGEYKPSNYDEEDYDGGYGDDLDHDVYGARTTTVYGAVPDVRGDEYTNDYDHHDSHSYHSDEY